MPNLILQLTLNNFLDFETAKETIQNKIQINFEQLINEIETQLDFNTIDSYLSLASQ